MTVFFLLGGSDVNLLKHDVKWHKQRHTGARINSKHRVTPRRIMNKNHCHHYPTQCICYRCACNEVSVWWLLQSPIAQPGVIKWPGYNCRDKRTGVKPHRLLDGLKNGTNHHFTISFTCSCFFFCLFFLIYISKFNKLRSFGSEFEFKSVVAIQLQWSLNSGGLQVAVWSFHSHFMCLSFCEGTRSCRNRFALG